MFMKKRVRALEKRVDELEQQMRRLLQPYGVDERESSVSAAQLQNEWFNGPESEEDIYHGE